MGQSPTHAVQRWYWTWQARCGHGLKDRLCEGNGAIRRFINIYVNEEDIRFLQGPATPLKAGDAVSIVPAIASGEAQNSMMGCIC